MAIAPFKLLSATTSAAAPFCLGHAFVQGEVPSGSQLAAGSVQLQCVAKNAWPDGSLKFAVLAGIASITGGVDLSVTPAIGSPVSGTALTLAQLKATGVAASIDCGAFGTAAWATTDWDSPFMQWVDGPVMASWIYRKQVGSDAHLVAWLEVRMWVGGAVEVLPWIENGYLNVAGPTNKSATYSFALGGTTRMSAAIDLKHHSRTPLISGAALSYWLGANPGVTPRHDPAYLQSTELVPTYSATRSATGLITLPTTYVPFQAGGIVYTDNRDGNDVMTNPGYQRPIGLLPEHDVAYLVCTDQPELLFQSVIRNGFSAGRYPIHYRDETTNRAPVMSAYPTLTVTSPSIANLGAGDSTTPTPTGGAVAVWDGAHHPSLGFMAYLVSGSFYHMETVQLIAISNYFTINSFNSRANSAGRLIPDYESVQTRQAAWGMRTMAQALCVTPDSDTALRNSIKAVVETVINYYHATFVAQANNPFGIIEGGESTYGPATDGWHLVSAFQQDFVTMTYGYVQALGLPLSGAVATKLAAFFQWKAKSIIGRLGTTADFRFENADAYVIAVSPAGLPNFQSGAGPWATDWAQIAAHTFVTIPGIDNTSWNSSTNNLLGGEFTSDSWGKNLWGNIHPAIAYAVRFGVPGALTVYNRMTGATNYSAITNSFTASPVWSVKPASIGASVMPSPGPKMRVGQLLAGKMAVSGFRGMGITPAQVATGFAKPSLLEQHIVGADPTSEFLWVADTVPAGLNLTVYEDSSAVASGADGVYNGNKTVYTDGSGSAGTYSFTLGVVSTVTSVTIAPSSGTITAGGTRAHTATVSGAGSPSQAVTWTTSLGTINASTGTVTAPAATGSIQTGTITATSTQDATKSGTATFTVAAAASTVTSVTVLPSTATGSQTFAATVAGAFSPSQAVTWSRTGAGSINATTGDFIAPAQTGSIQMITIMATSNQDGTKSGTATVTIAAGSSTLTSRTVTLTLGDTAGVCANLTGIKVAFFDEPSPELITVARYQSASQTTNAPGVLTFSFNSTLASGGIGLIALLMPDGRHYLQPQAVS